MRRKAKEERVVDLPATATAPRGARLSVVQPNRTPLTES